MIDREKAIKALEHCKDNQYVNDCNECDYGGKTGMFCIRMIDDILAMLKEQEAVEPIPYHRSDGTIFKYECRQCRTKIFKMDLFCRHCGRPVKWE